MDLMNWQYKTMIGCPDDKESFGCSLSPTPTSSPTSPLAAYGPAGNLKLATELATSTGKFWSPLPRKLVFNSSKEYMDRPATPNCPVPLPLMNTFGRKKRALKVPSLISERSPLSEIKNETGNQFGNARNPGTLQESLPTFELCLIGNK